MKELLKKFRYRKIALAVADGFIIAISALIADFLLIMANSGLSRGNLTVSIAVGTISCLAALALCGAYDKLWRYFNRKDYLSCVFGVAAGIAAAYVFIYIMRLYSGHIHTCALSYIHNRYMPVSSDLQNGLYRPHKCGSY